MKQVLAETPEVFSRGAERAPSVRWGLASLSLCVLLSSLDTSIANTALPVLARAFHAPFQALQWVVLAYLLASTSLIVSVGRLGDLAGRRRLLSMGLLLFLAASVLCAVAPSLGLLIAGRAVQGVGAAVMVPLALSFASEVVPKAQTGRAMGLLGTTSAIGTSLGPSLGGVLIAAFGWPAIFLVNVPLGVLALTLVYRHLPADTPRTSTDRIRFDHPGTVLLALTLAAYALAMTLGRGSFGPLNVALLVAAALGAGLFVVAETRAVSPLVRLQMFRDPVLSASLLMSTLVSAVMMATLVIGPFYLSRALGLPAALVGLAMSAGPLVAALAGVPSGRAVDRFGAHRVVIAGLVGIAGGCTLLALIPLTFGVPGYLAPLVIVTAAYALFQAANNTAVMKNVRPESRGVVSGLLSLSRNLGLITGASVLGAAFAHAANVSDITTAAPQAVATGMRTTFAVAAILVGAAVATAAWGRATSRRNIRQLQAESCEIGASD